MKFKHPTALKLFGTACIALALMPGLSHGQARPQVGAGGGGAAAGGAGGGPAAQMQQILKGLDLTADQKTQIQGITRDAQQDLRDAMSGIQDATPQERQQKMQDAQKIISDTKEKVVALLTDAQKTKFFPAAAKAAISQTTERVKAIQTASTKLDIQDDAKSQLKTLFDDDLKKLDGYKSDADAVTDAKSDADVEQKATDLMKDTRKQLVQILGPDDLKQLLQNIHPGGAGSNARGGANGGANAGVNSGTKADVTAQGKGLAPQDAPTTMPAAK